MPEELLPQVKGQFNAMRFLQASLKSGRVGHSYIFSGPAGVGKKSAAVRFAAGIMCQQPQEGAACGTCSSCRRLARGSYPYLQLISPEKDKIKIDQIRSINDFLKYKVEESVYRFIIIDEADSMTPEAANSLLKTLEEPPARTTFILLFYNIGKVFPTIISRCQVVNFTHLSRDTLLEILLDKGFNEKDIQGVLPVAQGSAGRALDLIEDEDLKETRKRIIGFITSLPVSISRTLEFAQECSELDISLCLNIIMSCYRDYLLLDSGNEDQIVNRDLSGLFGSGLSRDRIFYSIEKIMEAQQAAGQNANKQLVLENLFLELNGQAS
jgi:DNA polymerase-3 subunit delta'